MNGKVMILGNCVADRLQRLLAQYPGFSERFTLLETPIVYLIPDQDRADIAMQAEECEFLFVQPLFNYGPLNTELLRRKARPGHNIFVFSSPNFEGYFPDNFSLSGKTQLKWEPFFEWDSLIIFSCFVKGISIFDVEHIYCHHPLFRQESVKAWVGKALDDCARFEQGVDLSIGPLIIRNFTREKLFYSPRHPVDSILAVMLNDMANSLGLESGHMDEEVRAASFGFNQWPVITRHQSVFDIPDQPWFVIGGKRVSIEDAAMAYYNFYEFHPHVVEANLDKVIDI